MDAHIPEGKYSLSRYTGVEVERVFVLYMCRCWFLNLLAPVVCHSECYAAKFLREQKMALTASFGNMKVEAGDLPTSSMWYLPRGRSYLPDQDIRVVFCCSPRLLVEIERINPLWKDAT